MSLPLAAPLLVVLAGVLGAPLLPRVAGPAASARTLTAAAVAATVGVLSALALLGAAGLVAVLGTSGPLGWCSPLAPGGEAADGVIGAIAALGLLLAGGSAARYVRRLRREAGGLAHVDGVQVVAAEGPVAFAVPGRPGGIVIGDRLLGALETSERRVVLAHERAHLELHHHRYVRTAELCAAALPPLRPMARLVHFNCERWADEMAVTTVGSRPVVARAIAKAALMAPAAGSPAPGLGFDGPGTADRVEALLHPRATPSPVLPVAATLLTVAVTTGGSTVQLHHLAAFALHICPG